MSHASHLSHNFSLTADRARGTADRARGTTGRSPADNNDLFALARALVFTKEAYRTLRTKAAPRVTPPAGRAAPTLQAADRRADSFPIAAARADRPLTPWDLMDEQDSADGVTFATFQRRPHRERLVQDAA